MQLGIGLHLTRLNGVSAAALATYNFASGTLPAGLTFTRGSAATDVVGGVLTTYASGVPRLNTTGGLLIEPQRTNLAKNSDLGGLLAGTTKLDGVADPLGGTAAKGAIEDSTTAAHYLAHTLNTISFTGGVKYGYSCFVRAGHRTKVQLAVSSVIVIAADAYVNVDLVAKTITAVGASASGATLTELAGGWFRVGFVFTATCAGTVPNTVFTTGLITGLEGRLHNYVGAGVGAGTAWEVFGHQVEVGYGVTSYIPTTTTAVTRAAETLAFATPGSVSHTEGTIVFEGVTAPYHDESAVVSPRMVKLISGAQDSRLFKDAASSGAKIQSGGLANGVIASSVGTLGLGETFRAAFRWKVNDYALSVNGATPVKDTTADAFSGAFTDIRLGYDGLNATDGYWGGRIKKLTIYKTLDDAKLRELTFKDPLSVPDCAAWFRLSDLSTITAAAGAVSQVNDLSGNGYHMVQATGANQPKTGTRTINGKNVLEFDGTDDYMTLPSGMFDIPAAANTFIIVFQSDNVAAIQRLLTGVVGAGTRWGAIYQSTLGKVVVINNTVYSPVESAVTPDTGVHVLAMRFTGTGGTPVSGNYDGAPSVTGVGNAVTVTSLLFGVGPNMVTECLDGCLAEMVVYRRAITDAELNRIGAYIQQEWGKAWNKL